MHEIVPIVGILSDSTPFFVTVFGIAAVAILAFPLRRWIAMKERANERATTDAIEKAAQYAAKTERLEQRLAVVERILTDRSANLADEIERLRDSPLN